MPKGKCQFNEKWLLVPEYEGWIAKDRDKHYAKCILCVKSIDISSMAEGALRSHARGAKHIQLAGNPCRDGTLKHFMTAKTVGPSTQTTAICSKPATNVSSFVSRTECLKAEILWTLKTVKSHYSFNSCSDVSDTFKTMFPDSAIARQFSCGERKCSYLCNFGLAPYIKNVLTRNVNSEDGYVLLFDESLNEKNRLKQMDVHVRCWGGQNRNQVGPYNYIMTGSSAGRPVILIMYIYG